MSAFPVKDQVIKASAGSGKTFALSDRIVKILACQKLQHGSISPEQIVALTFTRAAAAEFVAKTLEKLAKAAASEQEAAELRREGRLNLPAACDAAFFRDLLRATLLSMQRLTLGTLDSFFAKLITCYPTEVDLDGGQIRTISDVEAAEIRKGVLDRMMAEAGEGEIGRLWTALESLNQGKQVATPLRGLTETVAKLQELLTLAREPGKWGDADAIWPKGVPELLVMPSEAEVQAAHETLEPWLEGWEVDKPSKEQFRNSLHKQFLSIAQAVNAGDIEDAVLDQFAGRLSPVIRSDGTETHQVKYGNLKEPFVFPPEICAAARIMARKTYALFVHSKLEQTKAMHALLARYEEIYAREIRARGRLTFSDNVTLLLNHPEKFEFDYRLDCSVKHWLFDEFQDTSTRQYKVLKGNIDEIVDEKDMKTEWRSVFVVGDLKQSLYGWRAGNPDLLRELDAKIQKEGDNRLNYTRRCAQPIVDLLNRVMGGLDAHGEFFSQAAAAKWAAEWGDHESKNPDRPEVGEAVWVRLKNLEEEASNGSDEDDEGVDSGKIVSQARWIGAHLHKSGLLAEGGLLKPGITCAILVSKNEQAAAITEVLRRNGVEAADEAAAEVAMDNPFTAGFVSLVKNTAHPTDGLSRGIAEMSPSAKAFVDACGGWEKARLRIAATFHEKGGEAVLQEMMQDRVPTGDSNGERFLAKRAQQLLTLAVAFDADEDRDLGRFANHLEHSTLRDTADPRTVQVLTIHRSKGLQYTAVYLPCLNSDKQKISEVRIKDPIVRTDEEFNPTWILSRPKTKVCEADPETLEAEVMNERAKASYENLCRLYVGMTRAIRRLVLVTDELKSETIKDLRREKIHRKYDFAALLEAVLGSKDGARVAGDPVELPGACKAEVVARHGNDSWIAGAIQSQAAAPVESADTPALEAFQPVQRIERLRPSKSQSKKTYVWKPSANEARGKKYGSLVHELFQHLAWDKEAFLEKISVRGDDEQADPHLAEAVAAIRTCLESKPVAELVLKRPEGAVLWQERKAALMHEGKLVTAVFDRVHVIPGKEAVVIDYKTNDCSLEQLKEMYQGQMDLYRIAVAKLCGLSAERVRCVLVHVRLGALVEC